jgi:Protein of unknown function (DUF2804)
VLDLQNRLTGQSTIPSITPKLFSGTRPLKRWRYVAVFCEELMACAAHVQIGPARQSFWALHVRGEERLRERTRMLPRHSEVDVDNGRMRIHDRGVALELRLEEDAGFSARCASGRAEVWTRKQAGIHAHGTLTLGGGAVRAIAARAVIDDTVGHHARVTEWRWSAGVGEGVDGAELAWNLVSGVNDPERGSERAVWVDGLAHEAPPVSFASDLSRIDCEDGSRLDFAAEAERSRREHLLIVSSDYRAPFGTFSGALPGGIELARGLGVVEHHRARW